MQLNHGLHLAYSTNVHRGESWARTFDALQTHTLAVRERVCPDKPYGIGLRLSERAAVELNEPQERINFRRWLERNHCYIFTINGSPYGNFHGTRIKENVFRPDWTSPERVAYTNLLFNLLAELLPPGMEGSINTLPGSFKEFHLSPDALKCVRQNLWHCIEHIGRVSEKTGRKLHLALEPAPLCLLESSAETIHFFEHLRAEHPRDERLDAHLGVNYDTCHFAVEYEEPRNALLCLIHHGIKIAKIQFSSALKVSPTPEVREFLKQFANDVYLHQVVARDGQGNRTIYRDLPDALSAPENGSVEWRIHFHMPLHTVGGPPFDNTNDHLFGVLDLLGEYPEICAHLEMETYTWEVMPPELKPPNVVDQIVAEYEWTLEQLRERGLAQPALTETM